MTNALEKVDPFKKTKPNLAELIEQLSENLIAHGKNIASFEEQSRRFYNVLESVGTESGRIYNEFTSERNKRERQLEQKIERLEDQKNALQQHTDHFRIANAFLKGRISALEQIAKVEPLEPSPHDLLSQPSPRNLQDFRDPPFR